MLSRDSRVLAPGYIPKILRMKDPTNMDLLVVVALCDEFRRLGPTAVTLAYERGLVSNLELATTLCRAYAALDADVEGMIHDAAFGRDVDEMPRGALRQRAVAWLREAERHDIVGASAAIDRIGQSRAD